MTALIQYAKGKRELVSLAYAKILEKKGMAVILKIYGKRPMVTK